MGSTAVPRCDGLTDSLGLHEGAQPHMQGSGTSKNLPSRCTRVTYSGLENRPRRCCPSGGEATSGTARIIGLLGDRMGYIIGCLVISSNSRLVRAGEGMWCVVMTLWWHSQKGQLPSGVPSGLE